MNLLLFFLSFAWAETLAGVSMPDTTKVGDTTLLLNGMGLREKFWIDIYVAGLYLPSKMSNDMEILHLNQPKQITLEFIYSEVTKEQMIEVLEENIANNPNFSQETIAQIRQCGSWMTNFHKGDTATFEYDPTKGTAVHINNQVKGTIPGPDFMKAIFAMYIGPHPATADLKQGLLGK